MVDTTPIAIVAIPSEDDYVWKISSEKIPHLTILNLGDQSSNPNLQKMIDFVEHASSESLKQFGLNVLRRGTLGPDNADVLFLGSYGIDRINTFRAYLLQNDNISLAYNSTPQFDQWTPHLTLGYPTKPAKPDNRDYPGIHWINFDKIAVWTGNYEGPTFELGDNSAMDMTMSMKEVVGTIISHHGIKGQKWGVRRKRKSGPVSEDAQRAAASKAIVKKSGTKALTNQELQHLVTRMNLEQQFSKLSSNNKSAGQKFAQEILQNIAKQQISSIANQAITKKVAGSLK